MFTLVGTTILSGFYMGFIMLLARFYHVFPCFYIQLYMAFNHVFTMFLACFRTLYRVHLPRLLLTIKVRGVDPLQAPGYRGAALRLLPEELREQLQRRVRVLRLLF